MHNVNETTSDGEAARHLNIFPSASRNTDIQEASAPSPLPPPLISAIYPPTDPFHPYTMGRGGAVLLIEPNFDRSAPPLPFSLSLAPDFGEVVRGRNFNVTSIQCPLGYLSSPSNASLATTSSFLLPHHPSHPWATRLSPPCDAKIGETVFKTVCVCVCVGKISIIKIYKEETDSSSFFKNSFIDHDDYLFHRFLSIRITFFQGFLYFAGKNIKIF